MKKSHLKELIIQELRNIEEQDMTASNPNASNTQSNADKINSIPKLQKRLKDLAVALPQIKGLDTKEIEGISSMIDTMLAKASQGTTSAAVKTTADKFQSATNSIK